VKVLIPPLVAVRPPEENPVTGSENVTVTGIDDRFVVPDTVDESVTVGPPVAAKATDANEMLATIAVAATIKRELRDDI
jgi:hypothetical protein